MGLRHLRGLLEAGGEIHVVDPRVEARAEVWRVAAEHDFKAKVVCHPSMDDVPFDMVQFDAAILSATANGRLERFHQVAVHGISDVLIEKPFEQSRRRFREIRRLARAHGVRVRCNHHLRTLPFFASLREQRGPFHIVVTGGAFGLGCIGPHWLDFAVYLTKSRSGKMLFGEIDDIKIDSGRGPCFRDYGGRGLFALQDGSRLFLSSSADSSAPTTVTVTQPTRHSIVDHEKDLVITYERDPSSTDPNYLVGANYSRSENIGVLAVQLPEITKIWIRSVERSGVSLLPTLDEAALGHELLFDLLETGGEREHPIT